MTVLRHTRPITPAPRTTGYHYASTTELTEVREDGTVLDLAAVERALNGGNVELTEAERYEAGRLLLERGYQPTAIDARTGIGLKRAERLKRVGWPKYETKKRSS